MALLLVCSAVTIILSSMVYYFSSVHILQNQYISSNSQLLAEVNQSVQRYYKQLNDVTLSLYSNSSFIEHLRLHQNDYISQAENEQTIKNILYADDTILYIYFYDPYTCNLYSYSRENMSYTKYPELEEEDWYQATLNAPKYFTISPPPPFYQLYEFRNPAGCHGLFCQQIPALLRGQKPYRHDFHRIQYRHGFPDLQPPK